MADALRVMIFTWNAAGLRICETMSQEKANESRTGFFNSLRKKNCVAPDFFEEMRAVIISKQPHIISIVTQDEDSSNTYFHSDFLPNSLGEINYTLLKREKLDNVGEISSGAYFDLVDKAKPSGGALRISIYVLNSSVQGFKTFKSTIKNNGQVEAKCKQGQRVSGGIASYVDHPIFGKIAFIGAHLPIGTGTSYITGHADYLEYRARRRLENSVCLSALLDKFVEKVVVEKPDHVFLIGDLNYDIVSQNTDNYTIVSNLVNNVNIQTLESLYLLDELKQATTEYPLVGYKEGLNNSGPVAIFPTWRLTRNRSNCNTNNINNQNKTIDISCLSPVREKLYSLGWHDRILYKDVSTAYKSTSCNEYFSFDIKNIHASTHAGVIGFFNIQ